MHENRGDQDLNQYQKKADKLANQLLESYEDEPAKRNLRQIFQNLKNKHGIIEKDAVEIITYSSHDDSGNYSHECYQFLMPYCQLAFLNKQNSDPQEYALMLSKKFDTPAAALLFMKKDIKRMDLNVSEPEDNQLIAKEQDSKTKTFRWVDKANIDLHEAVRREDAVRVAQLLGEGADVNAKTNLGNTALHFAIKAKNLDIIRQLLAYEADIDIENNQGCTPFVLAIKSSDLDLAELICDRKTEFERKIITGNTELHTAVAKGDKIQALSLLKNGADIHAEDQNGDTPLSLAQERFDGDTINLLLAAENFNPKSKDSIQLLFWAIQRGHKGIVQQLVTKGADVHAANEDGDSVLAKAIARADVEIINLILDKLVDRAVVNAQDKNGKTLLHTVIQNNDIKFNKEDKQAIVKLLLAHGADVHAQDKNGLTPLSWVYQKLDLDMINLLMTAKTFDANSKDSVQLAVWAAQEGNEAIVKKFLAHRKDVNAQDNAGRRMLCAAVERGHQDIVKQLLEKKADVNAKAVFFANTPLHLAASRGFTQILELLLTHGADVHAKNSLGNTALHELVMITNNVVHNLSEVEVMLKQLIAYEADVNAETKFGNTALSIVAGGKYDAMVKLLLDNGADVHPENSYGDTALHWAVRKGAKDTVELLLKEDANVHAQDEKGDSPLSLALSLALQSKDQAMIDKNMAVIELLTNATTFNANSKESVKLLYRAVQEKHNDVVKLLVAKGVDVNGEAEEDDTPLSWALRSRNSAMVNLLMREARFDTKSEQDVGLLVQAAKKHKEILNLLRDLGVTVDNDVKNPSESEVSQDFIELLQDIKARLQLFLQSSFAPESEKYNSFTDKPHFLSEARFDANPEKGVESLDWVTQQQRLISDKLKHLEEIAPREQKAPSEVSKNFIELLKDLLARFQLFLRSSYAPTAEKNAYLANKPLFFSKSDSHKRDEVHDENVSEKCLRK